VFTTPESVNKPGNPRATPARARWVRNSQRDHSQRDLRHALIAVLPDVDDIQPIGGNRGVDRLMRISHLARPHCKRNRGLLTAAGGVVACLRYTTPLRTR